MRRNPSSDHWRQSLDIVEAVRARMAEVGAPQAHALTRQLMAQVAHAKSSSFIALLDAGGYVLDINPAALIAGGVDRAEGVGLPLWGTAWWTGADPEVVDTVEHAVLGAAQGRFARFDVDLRI